jgi:hypothetical protein
MDILYCFYNLFFTHANLYVIKIDYLKRKNKIGNRFIYYRFYNYIFSSY